MPVHRYSHVYCYSFSILFYHFVYSNHSTSFQRQIQAPFRQIRGTALNQGTRAGGAQYRLNGDGQNVVPIHASLTGGDIIRTLQTLPCRKFQSTPPSREATLSGGHRAGHVGISIHASLAGGDVILVDKADVILRISIHASLAGGDV